MELLKVKLEDKPLFDAGLRRVKRELAAYAFESIWIWKELFGIYRAEVDGSLFVFFEDSSGCFLYLPPLGPKTSADTLRAAFTVMDGRNSGREHLSRIENVAAEDVPLYAKLGYECREKPCDYLCLRTSIAGYRGEKFKHKRSAYNHFAKNNVFEYLPFSLNDGEECLALYDSWAGERSEHNTDRTYRYFLSDNRTAFKVMLDSYAGLAMTGRVIKIAGRIKAFSFGYELDRDTFCVLYEVTDISVKGLSQYIFSSLAQELTYTYLNIMDDSGLETLREAKLSFHPEKLVTSYIAVRPPNQSQSSS